MRAVIVADNSMATRERAMLSRLEIGLADEGVRVVHAVPLNCLSAESGGLYSTAVGYNDRGLAFTRPSRTAQLIEAIRAADDAAGSNIDVVHCFGGDAWPLAAEIGRQTGSAVVLEVDHAGLSPVAAAMASGAHGGWRTFSCPDPALAENIRAHDVHVVPWGVHAPESTRSPVGSGSVSIALLAELGAGRAAAAALEAISRLPARAAGPLVFCTSADNRDQALWKAGRRLNMLDRLSILPDMEARREPILQADFLVLPDAAGRHHTLTLDAMAAGCVVVAAPDPMNSGLIDGRTARLVGEPTPQAWFNALIGLLAEPAGCAALARTAGEWVKAEHPVSAHVAGVLGVYAALAGRRHAPAAA